MVNEIYSQLLKEITQKEITAQQIQDDWDFLAHKNITGDLFDNFLIYLDEKYSSNKHDLQTLRELYSKIEYKYISNEIRYKDFAKEVIDKLKERGLKIVLATLATKKVIDIYNNENKNLINVFRINDAFDMVLTYDDVQEKKPNPEIYLKVIEKFDIPKKECLIIEDSLEGVMAAKNAGIEVLNIVDENMYKKQNEIDSISNYKLNNLKELYELIK